MSFAMTVPYADDDRLEGRWRKLDTAWYIDYDRHFIADVGEDEKANNMLQLRGPNPRSDPSIVFRYIPR